MAPIKLEDKLKDKLESRSLQPSADAWNSLSDRLDKEEDRNNIKLFWWLGIAASILGVILVTTQFYKTNEVTKELPVIVDTKTEDQRNSEPVNTEKHFIITEEKNDIIEDARTTEVASVSNTNAVEKQDRVKKNYSSSQPEKEQVLVASQEVTKTKISEDKPVKTLTHEELKVIEVVDVIKQLQSSESSVSDKEIDSLLKQAQREILKQLIYDETTRTVNAEALLQDVEVELEQSFRDKVFEALRSGYDSVKTAVAERNN